MSRDFRRVRDLPGADPRDDRPLIVPPDGGPAVPYERASSFGGVLEDKELLEAWKRRQTAIGIAQRPDLALAVSSAVAKAGKDAWRAKNPVNRLVDKAMDAAGSGARASVGTSMHELQEVVDSGGDPAFVPDQYRADLDAYLALTRPFFEHVAVEQRCVCDEVRVAGTKDRLSRLRQDVVAPDGAVIPEGSLVTVDEKTSRSLDYSQIKFAAQLAGYSRSVPYDPETDQRGTWPGPIRQDWGFIVHTPAGEGMARLVWVDLVGGWEMARLAASVFAARERAVSLLIASEWVTVKGAA
jgi:hypothetical protein